MKGRLLGTLLVVLAIAMPMTVRSVAAQDAAFLAVSDNKDLGAILTDAAGKTLYLFTPDTTAGESACYDECAANWPPLAPAADMTLPEGVPGELTTVKRTDGAEQVAYNGIPLYYFAEDDDAGDTYGQGLGGVWFVVAPGAMHGDYPVAPAEGTPVPTASARIGFTEELGPFLTDAEGRTVYLFTKDTTEGESACYDDCAAAWPPVPGEDGATLPPGIQGSLGTIARTDGSSQLAYNDIPLYYYSQDTEPGDTYGQDVHDVWYIVTPGMQFGDEPHEGDETDEEEAAEENGTPVASSTEQTVQVSLGNMVITPSLTTFSVGVPYTFVVANEDTIEHELVIERRGEVDVPLETNGHEAEVEDVEPGEAKRFRWTFTEPGEYQLACHEPGHFEAGMLVAIEVTS